MAYQKPPPKSTVKTGPETVKNGHETVKMPSKTVQNTPYLVTISPDAPHPILQNIIRSFGQIV
jgi:hypothetical protein